MFKWKKLAIIANGQEKCGFVSFGEEFDVRWIDKSVITMIQRKISIEDYYKRKNS